MRGEKKRERKECLKEGHDFADAARSDTIWKKAMKDIKEKIGGASIELITGYLKQEGMKALGMA